MTPEDVLSLFDDAAAAVRAALLPITGLDRLAQTERPGQYAIDLVADRAVLEVLAGAPVSVVSEESGRSGDPEAAITVVVDPVDGSTNCSRGLPYWCTALCAVDGDGLLAALVSNHVTGQRTTAVRGGGAWRDGEPMRPTSVERVEDAIVAIAGAPRRILPWAQFRALGSIALELCDVAAGVLDGFVDGPGRVAPWDYLAALLVCREAGVVVTDAQGRDLVTVDPDARRQPLAGATAALHARLTEAVA